MGEIADAMLDDLMNNPCEWCGKWPEHCTCKDEDQETPMTNQYQTITVTLSDGSKHCFTGPACIYEDGPQVVLPLQVGPPQDLPPDCYFDTFANLKAPNAKT